MQCLQPPSLSAVQPPPAILVHVQSEGLCGILGVSLGEEQTSPGSAQQFVTIWWILNLSHGQATAMAKASCPACSQTAPTSAQLDFISLLQLMSTTSHHAPQALHFPYKHHDSKHITSIANVNSAKSIVPWPVDPIVVAMRPMPPD
eukprot:706951-Amphidinium_carterae.1